MAITVIHQKVATLPDNPASQLSKDEWNDPHTVTLDGLNLIGKPDAGNGAAVEIPLGAGLEFSGGSLRVTNYFDWTIDNSPTVIDNGNITGLLHGTEVDNPSSGVHGVTGTVVGTSDSQTLTNKTVADFTNTVHADSIHQRVRNESGGVLTRGTPVFASGYSVGQDLVLVSKADASGSGTMPSMGLIADASLANNATGEVVQSGRVANTDTSAFSVGDRLFVSETAGELTSVKPVGTALVQIIGVVLRSHASFGIIEVVNAGGFSGLPNIPSANFWLGDATSAPIPVTMSGDATIDNAGAVTVSGAGIDTTAIHDDVASEISSIASKAVPAAGDFFLIEDSAAANVKKQSTFAQIESAISHANIAGVIANQHIDWTNATEDLLTIGDMEVSAFGAGVAPGTKTWIASFTPGTYATGGVTPFMMTTTGAGDPGGGTILRPFNFGFTISGANAATELTCFIGDGVWQGSGGNLGTGQIFSVNLRHQGAADISNAYAYRSILIMNAAGNTGTWRCFDARSPSVTGAGNLTASIGCNVENQGVTGKTTNSYGIFIQPQSGSSGINAAVYFNSSSGLANDGLNWNNDTNLYRSEADVLKTDDSLDVGGSLTLGTDLSIANGGTGQSTQAAAFDALAPTTTKGDQTVHDGSDNVRVAVGADGQRWIADSADAEGIAWVDEVLTFNFIIDGNGGVIPTGVAGDLQIDFACEITQVTMLADQSGSIVVDIFKDTFGNFPAVVGDSITAAAKPTITTSDKSQDSTLAGWTKTINAGDHLRFNVDSATTIERVTVALRVKRTE